MAESYFNNPIIKTVSSNIISAEGDFYRSETGIITLYNLSSLNFKYNFKFTDNIKSGKLKITYEVVSKLSSRYNSKYFIDFIISYYDEVGIDGEKEFIRFHPYNKHETKYISGYEYLIIDETKILKSIEVKIGYYIADGTGELVYIDYKKTINYSKYLNYGDTTAVFKCNYLDICYETTIEDVITSTVGDNLKTEIKTEIENDRKNNGSYIEVRNGVPAENEIKAGRIFYDLGK